MNDELCEMRRCAQVGDNDARVNHDVDDDEAKRGNVVVEVSEESVFHVLW